MDLSFPALTSARVGSEFFWKTADGPFLSPPFLEVGAWEKTDCESKGAADFPLLGAAASAFLNAGVSFSPYIQPASEKIGKAREVETHQPRMILTVDEAGERCPVRSIGILWGSRV